MSENYLQMMKSSSHISAGNAAYIDALYEQYLQNPQSVPTEWQQYFSQLPTVNGQVKEASHAQIREQLFQQARQTHKTGAASGEVAHELKQTHVSQMISAYRLHGHHHADLDPLKREMRKHIPDLDLGHYQFTDKDLDKVFSTESALTKNGAKLCDIYAVLQSTYCGQIGIEYMHITDTEQTNWLQQRMESTQGHYVYSAERKRTILKQLIAADGLERYLGTKYVGQKRFSLEGADSLVPMMHELIQRAGQQHVREVVIGMAHRGRLNMLVNILGKAPQELFSEFEGKHSQAESSGDVKYHMGFSSDVPTAGGVVHLALAFNPSHLEIIAPVVEGSVRSRQRRRGDLVEKKQVLPVVIHGDAAFAGQGVVMETFNFSQARGYNTGGTVHIVINNQVGFTTSNPLDARSTLYCTDVAKMVQAPIIHVNGDDPEAVIFATELAFDFRMRFKRDVVIDLVCYRRHGHNEADEPSVTQPMMYQKIKALPAIPEIYAQQLIAEEVVTAEQVSAMADEYRDALDKGHPLVETVEGDYEGRYTVDWAPLHTQDWDAPTKTAVPVARIQQLADHLLNLPKDFTPHAVVNRVLKDRLKMTRGEIPLDWGYAETMAYATLLNEGFPVRLSGQDSGRGTFAHRHAVLHDANRGEAYTPLANIVDPELAQFIVIDSVLSEEAVLGFEYGYASAEPNALVLWEAQFGDFANGAQVVIDQFISSGEQKWGRLCGLVMLLPHGYEGQGPEHSSARLERYLQLCAQGNMQVCVPTTPAQVFHMLRRQVIRPYRKPLIVMTPKSLLRHKLAVSTLEDLANGEFLVVIGEIDKIQAEQVQRVVLCSGKVYYDLLAQRRESGKNDVALIRIEQLYPFPHKALKAILQKYHQAKKVVWCQEEPKNQGAWYSSGHNMVECLQADQKLTYVGRDAFASPAVGYAKLHMQQQKKLVAEALGLEV